MSLSDSEIRIGCSNQEGRRGRLEIVSESLFILDGFGVFIDFSK
jgi:hypothetical protein